MYALIIVIGMLAPPSIGAAPAPLGVTSQIVGKFRNLEECIAAANQPHAGGVVPERNLSATWGVNWYCTYAGGN